jgi:hypothetical protein
MPVGFESSLELRWFVEGHIPGKLSRWYEREVVGSDSDWKPEASRVDTYLPTECSDHLNVKLRQGSLEVRIRENHFRFCSSNGRFAGFAESWSKWVWKYLRAFEADIQQAFAATQGSDWISVQKSRQQRKFGFVRGHLEPIPMENRSEYGGMLELSPLLVDGCPWWTLAIDTFGNPSSREEMLTTIVDNILSTAPVELSEHQSGSYATLSGRVQAAARRKDG